MPMMPAPVSASFTSSSLNGLMIASTLFMNFYDSLARAIRGHRCHSWCPRHGLADRVRDGRRALHLRITVGAHFGHVETLELHLRRHAHTHDGVHDFEEHPRGAEDEPEIC